MYFNKRNAIFLIILILGISLRLFTLHSLQLAEYTQELLADEQLYFTWAQNINTNYKLQSPYLFAPFPAYVFAYILKFLGNNQENLRYFNLGLGIISILIIFVISKQLFTTKVALISSLIASTYKTLIFYNLVPLKTSLEILLIISFVLFFIKSINNPKFFNLFFAGLSLGLSIYSREHSIIFILPCCYFLLSTINKKAIYNFLIFLIGLSFGAGYFTYHNYHTGGLTPLSSIQTGTNLYLANHINNPEPILLPVKFANPQPLHQLIDFILEANKNLKQELSMSQASNYWIKKTFLEIIDHPNLFLKKIFKKILLLMNNHERDENYDITYILSELNLNSFLFPSCLILALGIIGIIKSNKSQAILFLLSIIGLYSLTLLIFLPNSRYRLITFVLLIPFAASGFMKIIEEVRTLNYKAISKNLFILLSIIFISYYKLNSLDDLSLAYNTKAFYLNKSKPELAKQYLQLSIEQNKFYSDFAKIALASTYSYPLEAEKLLNEISNTSNLVSTKLYLLAEAKFKQKQYYACLMNLEQSTSINSGNIEALKLLGQLHQKQNPKRAREISEQLYKVAKYYQ